MFRGLIGNSPPPQKKKKKKPRWPPWPQISWYIFDFSYENTEWILIKFDQKKGLNILYRDCYIQATCKTKMATLASSCLMLYGILLCNRWMVFKRNYIYQEARSQHSVPSLLFWADRKTKMAALAFDWLNLFQLLFCNLWMDFGDKNCRFHFLTTYFTELRSWIL